mgnify:CR=1 FL=1
MQSPFSITKPASGKSFCNRVEEKDQLKKLISNSENILLYSHRRMGKTSLINEVVNELKNDVTAIYIDLYGTVSIDELISSVLRGVSRLETSMEKLSNFLKNKFNTFNLKFSFDLTSGAPVAIPSFATENRIPALEEVFGFLKNLSDKNKLLVVFDEFQEVATYSDSEVFEKKLRSYIQWHENVSYLFAGSQKSLLVEMFTDVKRAFYRQAVPVSLARISGKHYADWIADLYFESGRRIDKEVINDVVNRCDKHPMYIQEFFALLWDENQISQNIVDSVEMMIIKRRQSEFSAIWDTLTLNQRKTVKLLARTRGKDIFTAENLSRNGLKAASQVIASLKVLEKREIVSKNSVYFIANPMLLRWMQNELLELD